MFPKGAEGWRQFSVIDIICIDDQKSVDHLAAWEQYSLRSKTIDLGSRLFYLWAATISVSCIFIRVFYFLIISQS